MKQDKKKTIIVFVLLALSLAVMAADSNPGTIQTAHSRVQSSAAVNIPTIWSPNFDISTTNGGLLDIACDTNGHAHVIYRDATGNMYHVEHDGSTFNSPHLLGNGSGEAAICAVGTTIHIAWTTNNRLLQYTRRLGTGTGATWEYNVTISSTGHSIHPEITASSTQVWIFWMDQGDSQSLLAKGVGTSWSTELVCDAGGDSYDEGAIEYMSGRLHLAWNVGSTLYYRSYQSTTIEIDESVCTDLGTVPGPAISVSTTDVYVSYARDQQKNCSYRSRPIGTVGAPWSAPVNFTGGSTYAARMESNIAYVNGVLYFTWRSYVGGRIPVCHFRTFNGTWSSVQNVSATNERCQTPKMAISFDGVVIGFSTYPGGVPKLRYKYLPLGVRPQADMSYVKGTAGAALEWIVQGHVWAWGDYQIFRDGVLLASAGWLNDNVISIAVGGLGTGTYIYTIVVTETAGNMVIDSATVTVVEPDMSGLIAAIVIPCAIGGGLLVLFLLDKKKVIDLKKAFGKLKRRPSTRS